MKDKPIDLHQSVTDHIVAALERGAGEWKMPWQPGASFAARPRNVVTGNPYQGINAVLLACISEAKAYPHALFGSYRQWQELGAQVIKGAKASPVVFYKQYVTDPNPDEEGDDGKRRVARFSNVFNVAQVEGYVMPEPEPSLPPPMRIAHADAFITAIGAKLLHGGDRAYYALATDHIQMPLPETFLGDTDHARMEAYVSVCLHEHVHWSGAKTRLRRDFGSSFGTETYAFEELVAELGASFLMADLGISPSPRPDHAAYLASWLKILRNDNRAIFKAAAKASEAARFLSSFSVGREADDAEAA